MYHSIVEATGAGLDTAVNVAVPPYLDQSHITVFVNGVPTGYPAVQWINPQTVAVYAPAGQVIRVVRRTSQHARLTEYLDGQQLPGDVLEVDSKQAFYMAQEALDLVILSGGSIGSGTIVPYPDLTQGQIVSLLSGQVSELLLTESVRNTIAKLTEPATTPGSLAQLIEQVNADRAAGDALEAQARIDGLAAEATNRAAAIAVESQARADGDAALASQITTVAAQADSGIAAVQATATALANDLGTVEANYTLKVQARSDGLQAIAGIGLNSTVSNNVAQSSLVFMADNFSFVPSASAVNDTPMPLLQAGLVNGQNTIVIPPSRIGDNLIESRMIVDGGIEARHIKVGGFMQNLVYNGNPDTEDLGVAGWYRVEGNISGNTLSVQSSPPTGFTGKAFRVLKDTAGNNAAWGCKPFQVIPGNTYTIRFKARAMGSSPTGRYIRINYVGSLPTEGITASNRAGFTELVPGFTSWPTATTDYEFTWTCPAGANWATLTLYVWDTSPLEVWFDNVEVFNKTAPQVLIRPEGISADMIDTKGLSIKDSSGNVILSSGTGLNWSNIPSFSGTPPSSIDNNLVPVGRNLLYNSAFEAGMSGWGYGGVGFGGTTNWGVNFSNNWRLLPIGSMYGNVFYIEQINGSTNQADYVEIANQPIPVLPNTRYVVSWYGQMHRCVGVVFVRIYNAANQIIQDGAAWAPLNHNEKINGNTLGMYDRTSAEVTTASTAAYAIVTVRKYATIAAYGSSTSYMFATRLQFEAVPGTAGPSPWTDSTRMPVLDSSNITTFIANAAIGNAQIGGDIQSDNFVAGSSGWRIRKSTGDAEFRNVLVRGDIQATSINGAIVGTGNIAANAVTVTASAQNASSVTLPSSGAETTICSTTIDTGGQPLTLIVNAEATFNSTAASQSVTLRVKTGSTVQDSVVASSTASGQVITARLYRPVLVPSPGSGNITVSITGQVAGGFNVGVSAKGATVVCLGTKR